MPIPVALSTGSVYTYGTARAFELAARAGYDGVEVIVDDRWDTRQAGYLRRLVDEYEIPILSVHSPFAMLRLPGWARPEVERIKLALGLAEEVGARTLNLHVPLRIRDFSVGWGTRIKRFPLPVVTADQRGYREWLTGGGLAALQAQTALRITVENLPRRTVLGRKIDVYALNTWAELEQFPNLCLDTTHTGTTGADIAGTYARLAPRVKHIHLSDYDGKYQHRSIGTGHLPLAAFVEMIGQRGFDGVLVVELDPGGLPVHDEAKVEAELRRNLEFCRQHLGQPAAAMAS
jgi:sugar phosphate isomerase/epimerase